MEHKKISRSEYSAIHYWLKRFYGVADRCENKDCPGKSKKYEWAKLRGKEYDFNRDNFFRLCKSCHRLYDMTEQQKKLIGLHGKNHNKKFCKYGHEYTEDSVYSPPGHPEWRHCKLCKPRINREHLEKVKGRTVPKRNKLTLQMVMEIRTRKASGERIADIAKDYPCGYANVSAITRGRSWSLGLGD